MYFLSVPIDQSATINFYILLHTNCKLQCCFSQHFIREYINVDIFSDFIIFRRNPQNFASWGAYFSVRSCRIVPHSQNGGAARSCSQPEAVSLPNIKRLYNSVAVAFHKIKFDRVYNCNLTAEQSLISFGFGWCCDVHQYCVANT